MKTFTRQILTQALLLWAFAPLSLGNTIYTDDPQFVKLSDGRQVPFGSGVICSDECVNSAAIALPDPGRRPWLWVAPITTVGVLCAVLCRPASDPPPVVTNPPLDPPSATPTPTPRREVPPRPFVPPTTEVPEPASLTLLGLGLMWGAIRLGRRS